MTEASAGLVIIDLFLPGTSGMEVLKVLQQMHGSAGCILITRINTRGMLDRAFRYGARDVLIYPVDAETLRHTVAHRLDLPIQLKPSPPAEQAAPAKPGKS
jgi:response regulator of citrate/malate metabolism